MINKIIFAGTTIMDLTADTVTPETLLAGITAHDKTGVSIVGTAQSGGGGAQTASGTISGYSSGRLSISGLGFRPKAVIVRATASYRGDSTVLYGTAVDSPGTSYNAQGIEELRPSFYGITVTALQTNATFSDNSVSFTFISNPGPNAISVVSWWAFGGG